jgi:hypothetical protein
VWGPCLSQELIDLDSARSPKNGRLALPGFLVILLTMTVLPLGDVKSHLSELVGRVHDHHERVTVTVHGRPLCHPHRSGGPGSARGNPGDHA